MEDVLSILESTNCTSMSKEDFAKMLQEFEPGVFNAETCESLMAALGTDGNGKIDLRGLISGSGKSVPLSGAKPTHVAIIGAGFVGTMTAYALMMRSTGAIITLTDVNEKKCEGEVADLEDSGVKIRKATPKEAGQADVIVITAGRGQKEGETRLDLIKANAAIMVSIVNGMKPIKSSAKIIVVSNPCDALTYKVQECSGLPVNQVFGSGCVLDTRRLRLEVANVLKIHQKSIVLWVLGEHGDSQFPAASLAKIGVRPMLEHPGMGNVDINQLAVASAGKAYEIISKKRYTAFGVATCVEKIVEAVLFNNRDVLPVSVRVPGKQCCTSMPAVVGINGIESIENIVPFLSASEKEKWDTGLAHMEVCVKVMNGEVDTKDVAVPVKVVEQKPRYERDPFSHKIPAGGHAPTHVAIVGAGFVGTTTAYAMCLRHTGAKVTLTDVATAKCIGEVLDLEDTSGQIDHATPAEAGQADVIVISAGRGQKEGETRLDLVKANANIMRSVINGMKPIKPTAKIIVVSNPCDALTFVAQECSGLPQSQVFGSGTVLDSRRLCVELGQTLGVSNASLNLFVLGEHGDAQFPCPSCANIGGLPLKEWPGMDKVDVVAMAAGTGKKAYDIIGKKGYTAFGVATAVEKIVECVMQDWDLVMPVSVRVPGKRCCMSLPCVVGIGGVKEIMDVTPNLDEWERKRYDANIEAMEVAAAAATEGA